MIVFVISLIDSPRRLTLKDRMKEGGIDEYEVIDAEEVDDNLDVRLKEMNSIDWRRCSLMKNMRKDKSRKACYLSYVKLLRKCIDEGIEECLICEDDIIFKGNVIDALSSSPMDSVMSFFDTTRIDGKYNKDHNGWSYIDGFDVWCLGCSYYHNIFKIYWELVNNPPKVVDKMIIQYIQRDYKTYLYLPSICKQDRKSFDSDIY
jgi:hypothetical protein